MELSNTVRVSQLKIDVPAVKKNNDSTDNTFNDNTFKTFCEERNDSIKELQH